MQLGLPLLTTALAACSLACDPDNCADLPTSFHLDVELDDKEDRDRVSLLRVEVLNGADRFRRFFEVGDAFSDGKTSIGVELDPAPTEEVDIAIAVAAYVTTSTATPPAAEQTAQVELEPNGCNRYRVELDL